jgi:hypothetical protein
LMSDEPGGELKLVARLDGGDGDAVPERRVLGNRELAAATDYEAQQWRGSRGPTTGRAVIAETRLPLSLNAFSTSSS